MSVVCAKVYENKIVIAADSIAVAHGDTKIPWGYDKLVQINDMTIGDSGDCEEEALFGAYVKTHKPEGKSALDITRFMVEFSKWKNDFCDNKRVSNAYIFCYMGELYQIYGISAIPVKDFCAIGYGDSYALTALHLGHTPKEAVKVTSDLCCYVADPIVEFEINR